MHYIFPDEANRVRIQTSGRTAPGLFKFYELIGFDLKRLLVG